MVERSRRRQLVRRSATSPSKPTSLMGAPPRRQAASFVAACSLCVCRCLLALRQGQARGRKTRACCCLARVRLELTSLVLSPPLFYHLSCSITSLVVSATSLDVSTVHLKFAYLFTARWPTSLFASAHKRKST